MHSYLPNIAKVYGINAALVYQHISWCSEYGRHRFVPLTVAKLAKRYPYLGTKQIRKALHKLTRPARNRPVIVVCNKEGRSWSYAPVPEYNKAATRYHVDFETACRFGVTEGIIMANFGFWIRQNWEQRSQPVRDMLSPDTFDNLLQMERFIYTFTKEHAFHHMRISDWVDEFHPYLSLSSAQRAFARLRVAKLLDMTFGSNKLPIWYLPPGAMDNFVRNQLVRMGLFSCLEKHNVKRANTVSKGQMRSQNGK